MTSVAGRDAGMKDDSAAVATLLSVGMTSVAGRDAGMRDEG